MPIVSTLGFALMSLLARGPATGYDLARRMRAPIGYFWAARHSQIYPELARLASAGLVRASEGKGPGPRAKKTYALTPAGRTALAEWLPRPPTFQPRSEVTLKAYAVNSADPRSMAEMYDGVATEAAAALARWESELAQMREAGFDDPAHPSFGNYAALRMGVESQRVLRGWASWLAGRLRGTDES
jgi:DNA-binding PadR family transcriptional regulator